jgi:Fe-S cluster biogenesis protein NfuA
MTELIDRIERDGGTIEVLQDERGMTYHRVCAHGICRSCEDRWQAEMYLDQMLRSTSSTPPSYGA